ncbi:putative amidase C550.07 [Aspergillus lentulus]|nr:putative amidase C550.07 [Aspergillus lentulus]
MTRLSEPAYLEIARRKQGQLDSGIPTEWRLPARLIPADMLSPPIAATRSQAYPRENVMDIPRRSGLLTPKELSITENWDVRGLLAQMRQGTLSAEDVVRAFSKAQHLDSVLQRTGRPVGPLHGLPVSVKDCFRIKGVDSCIGLTALAFKPSTFHAQLVNMLLSLGAVIIAKTNVSQGMAAPDSYNHVFGRTLNPLNHQLTVGGSSGGEAALVAMRGSMVGFGTDIGGSIRVPAMCTGLYGFKPSVGRIPFGGVVTGQPPGLGRVALQGVAGPLARSVADLGTVLAEIIPIAERFGEDCIPGRWESESPVSDRQAREFTVGVLRADGLVAPLRPVAQVLDEVADSLRRTPGVWVVDVPVPPALRKCQGIAGRLMGADGGGSLLDLLESTSEPLIPWLQKRMKRREALSLEQLIELQEQRSDIEKELLGMWTVDGDCTKRIDAIITPVAPHPVPEIDRFNAIGYTASFVLLDCPAGTIPVRNFTESDLDSGNDMDSPVLGSWDRVNRELWQGKSVDRRVYLDSPLSIQVVTPKQHDYELFRAMEIIDRAIQSQTGAMESNSRSSIPVTHRDRYPSTCICVPYMPQVSV